MLTNIAGLFVGIAGVCFFAYQIGHSDGYQTGYDAGAAVWRDRCKKLLNRVRFAKNSGRRAEREEYPQPPPNGHSIQ